MKRTHEVLVGLLLTAGLIIAVIGTIWLSRGGLAQGYPLYSRFQWGAGLKQGQQVQLGGVAIGYVDDLELDMAGGTVLVTMRIQPKYKVPQTTTATVIRTPTRTSSRRFIPGATLRERRRSVRRARGSPPR